MKKKTNKQKVLEFLKSKDFCVLATADPAGKPEAAVMAYTVNDYFIFYIFTEPETRKYKNIAKNNKVSFVVSGWQNDATVQIDGLISELNIKEGNKAREFVLSVHPDWQVHFDSPQGKWFEIKPLWLRYSDFNREPPEIMEMTDSDW